MTHRSKSTLFLIEQLIVIAVFAICAVACVSILTAAYLDANESRDISQALLKAESGAEVFKSTGGDLMSAAEILGGTGTGGFRTTGASEISIFYNKDWQLCESGDAVFLLSITVNNSEMSSTSDVDLMIINGTLTAKRVTGEKLVSFPVSVIRN